MSKNLIVVIYLLAMVASVVVIDLLFFRHRFRERLIFNIGIVMVYIAFYLAYISQHH